MVIVYEGVLKSNVSIFSKKQTRSVVNYITLLNFPVICVKFHISATRSF